MLLQVISRDDAENLMSTGSLLLQQDVMGQVYGVPSQEIEGGLEDGRVLPKSQAQQSWSLGALLF